mmetsp:Transcript_17034/g.30514  ORF Transcript_17034/g.30514 Transcript_17034/m.30514 type:complete len:229 (+) Transcript_17034:1379-2065(+)
MLENWSIVFRKAVLFAHLAHLVEQPHLHRVLSGEKVACARGRLKVDGCFRTRCTAIFALLFVFEGGFVLLELLGELFVAPALLLDAQTTSDAIEELGLGLLLFLQCCSFFWRGSSLRFFGHGIDFIRLLHFGIQKLQTNFFRLISLFNSTEDASCIDSRPFKAGKNAFDLDVVSLRGLLEYFLGCGVHFLGQSVDDANRSFVLDAPNAARVQRTHDLAGIGSHGACLC